MQTKFYPKFLNFISFACFSLSNYFDNFLRAWGNISHSSARKEEQRRTFIATAVQLAAFDSEHFSLVE